ncbi:amidophosphoribosyltransferase [Massilia sp. Root418]|jgi:amidophosphoribosyltransferase|uniref:amidophosphoribosyltransferase n=1 Tax=Massilia sp. Root418 TaxID=1736532 RepID=UPI0006FEB7EA|nr:amidophosphoribosyltransferase [Massilia sp. Root418]KQW87095.1 amidophosphoribosyltransferase [Massilia sp. Root418]
MCGIVGVLAHAPANQTIYDALLLLQHRGQQAAGIATDNEGVFAMHKANGLVTDAFRTRNMRSLRGNAGIGHCSCAAYGPSCDEEAQPFYVNAPFGITLAHNGWLSNGDALRAELSVAGRRHMNTASDAEVLLNVLAHELHAASKGAGFSAGALFAAVAALQARVRGSYAAVAQIAGQGLLAFRDPEGVRPLCIGVRSAPNGDEYMAASESVALDGMGFGLLRDVAPGEAIFIGMAGALASSRLPAALHAAAPLPASRPSAFEFVSLARPDSIIDGASVYAARLKLGELLAEQVRSELDTAGIDVVMPVDDIARPAAIQLALRLGIDYREGFIQNRYPGRSFDLPAGAARRAVSQRLNAIAAEFKGKRLLLVEDAIVDGASSREVVQLARNAGASYVALASTAPPVLKPDVYGVDWPARRKPAAMGGTREAMRQTVTADALVFQSLSALKAAIASVSPALQQLETSCFDVP